jgi:hypothetical protein
MYFSTPYFVQDSRTNKASKPSLAPKKLIEFRLADYCPIHPPLMTPMRIVYPEKMIHTLFMDELVRLSSSVISSAGHCSRQSQTEPHHHNPLDK